MQSKLTMPTRHITNPKFKYIPAALTDVRKTFAKFERAIRMKGGAS